MRVGGYIERLSPGLSSPSLDELQNHIRDQEVFGFPVAAF
jgi:hypothetical protein